MTLRIGSLFSGYGGLDMAVQAVYGGEVAWYSEIDKHACQVLAAHHPGVPNLGDITAVDWSAVPSIDILTGGYPCQPFSHAGKRAGTNDERHLWPYVRDAIAALRPVVTVLENVDGHRSLGLDVVLGDIADMGLSARWGVVRAADAGAPHGRKRVFIVVTDPADTARGTGGTGPGRGVSEPERPAGLAAHAGDAAADADMRRREQRDAGVWSLPVADAISSAAPEPQSGRRGARQGLAEAQTGREVAGVGDGGGATAANSDRGGYGGGQDSRGVGCLEAGDEGSAREWERARPEPVSGVDWGKYAPAIHRWERLTRPAPNPTTPGTNGRPRLNPAFVEWMMGLPKGHVTGHDLRPAACLKMLGNGVCPQQAELALRMLAVAA